MSSKTQIGKPGSRPRSVPPVRQQRTAGRPHRSQPAARARSYVPGRRSPVKASRGGERRPLVIAGAAVLAGAVALAAYLYFKPDRPTAECVIAVDAQGSTQQMVATYQGWLPKEIRDCALADRARVDVLLINGDTSTSRTMPVTLDLSQTDGLTGNATDDNRILNARIDSFIQQAASVIFHAPPSPFGTDLIATSCVASPLLAHHAKATLIIDSDGINNRTPYNFGFIPLDDQHITDYIHDLRRTRRICDLSGVTVKWYGAGVGSGTSGFRQGTLPEVQRFWSAYFSESGTTLSAYQRSH